MEKLEITKEKVLEAASKCEVAKQILQTLFPECFYESKKICFESSDGYSIKEGEKYFNVYQKDAFVKEELAKSNSTYATDWNHTRFKEEKNAYQYMIDNNKHRFTIMQIEHACYHSNISKEDTKKLMDFFNTRIL